jgi:hypothetical protein
MMMLTPPLTPIAYLNGNRCSAKIEEYSLSTMIAVMRRIAEGTPSGQSLVLSSGLFSNATRYVCRRKV